MSGTNYTHEQILKERIAQLERENTQLKMQLQLIEKTAQFIDQVINNNVSQEPLPRKFDAHQS